MPEPGLDAEVQSTETREHAAGMRSNPDEGYKEEGTVYLRVMDTQVDT